MIYEQIGTLADAASTTEENNRKISFNFAKDVGNENETNSERITDYKVSTCINFKSILDT